MPNIPDLIIPLWILLVPYGLFAAFFILWSLFNVYHLLRFGVASYSLSLLMVIYLAGTSALIFFSASLLLRFDWTVTINLTDILFSDNGPSIFPTL